MSVSRGKSNTSRPSSRTVTSRPSNPVVFFDISIGGETQGRISMELFAQEVPHTALNFRTLCTARAADSDKFKGSVFHKVIPGFMCQGGDFLNGDGSGHKTIYGAANIPVVEGSSRMNTRWSLTTAHVVPVLDDPAKEGSSYICGSQFYILFDDSPFLDDGSHTVFGTVVKGFEVVREIEKVGTRSGFPTAEVKITNSGQLSW